MLLVLSVAGACSGGGAANGRNGPSASTGPTILVGGEPVAESEMTDAVGSLCVAEGEAASDRPLAAEARFFDESHEVLHLIARALEEVDRPLSSRLLEAKQAVEADLSGFASPGRLSEDLGVLVASGAQALLRLEVPVPACAK